MRWTEKQVEFLKKHYTKASKEFLTKYLGRGWDAIRNKASSYNLKREDGSSLIDAGLDDIEDHMF